MIKRQVVDQLVDHFGDNILVSSSPGVSSIVGFRNKAPILLKLHVVPSDDDSDSITIKNVGKQIVREVKVLKSDKGHYKTRICKETSAESACDTIKFVFIMMLYIRVEREGDWPLHLEAVIQIRPYFYASGHINYARYGLFYLRSIEKLPVEIRGRFMKGEHVMHHIPGLWNGLWSDMYIESTFMRYGHSHGGIIGITLQPETLKFWALGFYIRSRIVEDMTNMSDQHSVQTQETHNEESKSIMQADAADRKIIREKLEQCINPLVINSETDSQQLVNIVSGRVAPAIVNVDNAVDIGTKQMEVAEKTWPVGFHGPISKR